MYWGHGKFGIESASMFYFGKHPSFLTVGESALLAGILPAPEILNPFTDPERLNFMFFKHYLYYDSNIFLVNVVLTTIYLFPWTIWKRKGLATQSIKKDGCSRIS